MQVTWQWHVNHRDETTSHISPYACSPHCSLVTYHPCVSFAIFLSHRNRDTAANLHVLLMFVNDKLEGEKKWQVRGW